jgi:hypothetical protein
MSSEIVRRPRHVQLHRRKLQGADVFSTRVTARFRTNRAGAFRNAFDRFPIEKWHDVFSAIDACR